MSQALQQVVVAALALGAAGFVVRRVITALRPPSGQAACPSCASGSTACADRAATAASTPEIKPLVLIRSKPR